MPGNDATNEEDEVAVTFTFTDTLSDDEDSELDCGLLYNEQDMLYVLQSRLCDARQHTKKPCHIIGPADIGKFELLVTDALQQADIKDKARYLIVPCFIAGEWLGVFLDLDATNQLAAAVYFDSRRQETGTAYENLSQIIAKLFPGSVLLKSACIKQDKPYSSGQFVIENFLTAVTGKDFPTSDVLDKMHLHSVMIHQHRYYSDFLYRQKFANNTYQSKKDSAPQNRVSPEDDELFKTLLLMNYLYTEINKSHTAEANYQAVRDDIFKNYVTLKNEEGQLTTSFVPQHSTAAETVHALVPNNVQLQLAVEQTITDLRAFTGPIGYERPDMLIGAGATAMGLTLAADIAAGVEIALTLANPVFLIPAVLLTTYSAAKYSIDNRCLKIALTFNMYANAEDNDTIKLFENTAIKLEGELYGVGPEWVNVVSRNTRHAGSSYEQLAFAYLLLGISKAVNPKTQPYEVFKLALYYAKAASQKEYRQLALLWLIHILTPITNSADNAATSEQNQHLVTQYIKELLAINPEIENELQEYIAGAIRLVLNYVRMNNNYENIEAMKIQLRKVINFGPVRALRHLSPLGKVNELVLTFLQNICVEKVHSRRKFITAHELIDGMDLSDVTATSHIDVLVNAIKTSSISLANKKEQAETQVSREVAIDVTAGKPDDIGLRQRHQKLGCKA